MNWLIATILYTAALGSPLYQFQVDYTPRINRQMDLPLWRMAVAQPLQYGQSHVPLFLRATDPKAKKLLEELGFATNEEHWKPINISATTLQTLLRANVGVEMRLAPRHHPLLEFSQKDIAADQVHRAATLSHKHQGKGVLIGFIDTGIDLGHPAFLDANSRSRVVALWDQDKQDPKLKKPRNFGYGQLCKAKEIRRSQCTLDDPIGHGTHVAGIAAGSSEFSGIAPKADIAMVRSNEFTRVADAVAFLFQLADDRNQPVVVNISVGGHYGPHDGRSPLENYLSQLVGPGKIIVAAAGNDGEQQTHFKATLSAQEQRLKFNNVPWGKSEDIILELWSDGQTNVEMSVEMHVDNKVVAAQPLIASQSDFMTTRLRLKGNAVADISLGVEYDNARQLAQRMLILNPVKAHRIPPNAALVLRLKGSGNVDGWLSQKTYRHGHVSFAQTTEPGWISGDSNSSITVPGTSPDIITVGAYTTREKENEAGILNRLANFSSRGPTFDPAYTGVKPDVSAPGKTIASARSYNSNAPLLDGHPELSFMQGTSMAAPHITGVIALMLQADPDLDPQKIKKILKETSRQDSFTGQTPNHQWGHGKIDALAAVTRAEEQASGCNAAPLSAWLLLLPLGLWRQRRRNK
ncbi:MAG: hypothetical protein CMH60_03260 [Myxococcales bacterium]|nr:hypothetical protein [Myxococcales bacterium]